MRKFFSSEFDDDAKKQMSLLNKANIRYCDDIDELSRHQKYIGKNNFKLMQPLALRPFANIIHKNLKNISKNWIAPKNI